MLLRELALIVVVLQGGLPNGFGQAAKDASGLVREVSEAARETKRWLIEGSIKYQYAFAPEMSDFILEMRSPQESRFRDLGGPNPATIVCDGSNAWSLLNV